MLNKLKKFLNLDYYISGLDQFLFKLRQQRQLSVSQRAEKQKYSRIYALRDQASTPTSSEKKGIWSKF